MRVMEENRVLYYGTPTKRLRRDFPAWVWAIGFLLLLMFVIGAICLDVTL